MEMLRENRLCGRKTTSRHPYDANGNLTSITPPGRPAHTFAFNAFDLEATYTAPAVEGITNTSTEYEYNLDKQLELITRPDDKQIDFVYSNTNNHLEQLIIPRGSYRYTYIPSTGQLDTITSPDNTVLDYGYDGFLLTDIVWSGEISGSIDFTYNNNFLVTQRCVNASHCISLSYDDDSLLTQAGSLSITHATQKGGIITGTTQGSIQTSRTYNNFGQLENIDTDVNSADIYGVTYIHDKLGRITEKTEVINGVTTTEIYGYDLAGRLETITRGGDVITYRYDDNSNRESKLLNGVVIEIGDYDNQDRLTSYNGCSYQYTANGELTQKTCGTDVTQYTYDVLGNLIDVTLPDGTSIEYLIDGQNRRIGKKINGALVQGFLYTDQLNPIAELNADGSIKSRFVYGTKANVPTYMVRDGVTYRIISNHLGSPRLVINATDGTVVQRMDYDEFGNVINDTNPGFQPFGFAGGIYDKDTELVRFGFRDYDASIGRWLSSDPARFFGGMNFYVYVGNDPINYVDPTGLVDINMLPRNPENAQMRMDAMRINNPDAITVAGHGNPDGLYDMHGNIVNPKDLAEQIKNLPNYSPIKPVHIYSCEVGKDPDEGGSNKPFAERVADHLPNPVAAPTQPIGIPNGNPTIPVSQWPVYQ